MYISSYVYTPKLSPKFLWDLKFDFKLKGRGMIFKILKVCVFSNFHSLSQFAHWENKNPF